MSLLATLLLGHLIADFPLQTDSIVRLKHKNSVGIFVHVSIHVLVTALLLVNPFQHWEILLAIGIVHFTIDWVKVNHASSHSTKDFVTDQLAHVISLALISLLTIQGWLPPEVGWLPPALLYPALCFSAMLGCMVCAWVWANGLSENVVNRYRKIRWVQQQMLLVTQRAGMGMLGCLVVGVVIF